MLVHSTEHIVPTMLKKVVTSMLQGFTSSKGVFYLMVNGGKVNEQGLPVVDLQVVNEPNQLIELGVTVPQLIEKGYTFTTYTPPTTKTGGKSVTVPTKPNQYTQLTEPVVTFGSMYHVTWSFVYGVNMVTVTRYKGVTHNGRWGVFVVNNEVHKTNNLNLNLLSTLLGITDVTESTNLHKYLNYTVLNTLDTHKKQYTPVLNKQTGKLELQPVNEPVNEPVNTPVNEPKQQGKNKK